MRLIYLLLLICCFGATNNAQQQQPSQQQQQQPTTVISGDAATAPLTGTTKDTAISTAGSEVAKTTEPNTNSTSKDKSRFLTKDAILGQMPPLDLPRSGIPTLDTFYYMFPALSSLLRWGSLFPAQSILGAVPDNLQQSASKVVLVLADDANGQRSRVTRQNAPSSGATTPTGPLNLQQLLGQMPPMPQMPQGWLPDNFNLGQMPPMPPMPTLPPLPDNFNLGQLPPIPDTFNLGQFAPQVSQAMTNFGLLGASQPVATATTPAPSAGKSSSDDAASPVVGQAPIPFAGFFNTPAFDGSTNLLGSPPTPDSIMASLRQFWPVAPVAPSTDKSAQASAISEVRVRPEGAATISYRNPQQTDAQLAQLKIKSALRAEKDKENVPLLWFRIPTPASSTVDDEDKSVDELEIETKLQAFEQQVIAELKHLQQIERVANEMRANAHDSSESTLYGGSYKLRYPLSRTPVHKITRADIERALRDDYVRRLLYKEAQRKTQHNVKRQTAPLEEQTLSKEDIVKVMAYAYRMAGESGDKTKLYAPYRAAVDQTQRQWTEEEAKKAQTPSKQQIQQQPMMMQQRQWEAEQAKTQGQAQAQQRQMAAEQQSMMRQWGAEKAKEQAQAQQRQMAAEQQPMMKQRQWEAEKAKEQAQAQQRQMAAEQQPMMRQWGAEKTKEQAQAQQRQMAADQQPMMQQRQWEAEKAKEQAQAQQRQMAAEQQPMMEQRQWEAEKAKEQAHAQQRQMAADQQPMMQQRQLEAEKTKEQAHQMAAEQQPMMKQRQWEAEKTKEQARQMAAEQQPMMRQWEAEKAKEQAQAQQRQMSAEQQPMMRQWGVEKAEEQAQAQQRQMADKQQSMLMQQRQWEAEQGKAQGQTQAQQNPMIMQQRQMAQNPVMFKDQNPMMDQQRQWTEEQAKQQQLHWAEEQAKAQSKQQNPVSMQQRQWEAEQSKAKEQQRQMMEQQQNPMMMMQQRQMMDQHPMMMTTHQAQAQAQAQAQPQQQQPNPAMMMRQMSEMPQQMQVQIQQNPMMQSDERQWVDDKMKAMRQQMRNDDQTDRPRPGDAMVGEAKPQMPENASQPRHKEDFLGLGGFHRKGGRGGLQSGIVAPTVINYYQLPPPPPSYSAPSYSPPSYSAPSYSAPSYSAPSYGGSSYASRPSSYGTSYGGGGRGSNAYGGYRAAIGNADIDSMLRQHQIMQTITPQDDDPMTSPQLTTDISDSSSGSFSGNGGHSLQKRLANYFRVSIPKTLVRSTHDGCGCGSADCACGSSCRCGTNCRCGSNSSNRKVKKVRHRRSTGGYSKLETIDEGSLNALRNEYRQGLKEITLNPDEDPAEALMRYNAESVRDALERASLVPLEISGDQLTTAGVEGDYAGEIQAAIPSSTTAAPNASSSNRSSNSNVSVAQPLNHDESSKTSLSSQLGNAREEFSKLSSLILGLKEQLNRAEDRLWACQNSEAAITTATATTTPASTIEVNQNLPKIEGGSSGANDFSFQELQQYELENKSKRATGDNSSSTSTSSTENLNEVLQQAQFVNVVLNSNSIVDGQDSENKSTDLDSEVISTTIKPYAMRGKFVSRRSTSGGQRIQRHVKVTTSPTSVAKTNVELSVLRVRSTKLDQLIDVLNDLLRLQLQRQKGAAVKEGKRISRSSSGNGNSRNQIKDRSKSYRKRNKRRSYKSGSQSRSRGSSNKARSNLNRSRRVRTQKRTRTTPSKIINSSN